MDKLSILVRLLQQIWILSFLAGLFFLFLGKFDVIFEDGHLKSVPIRPNVEVVPLVYAGALMLVALCFYVVDLRIKKHRDRELVTDSLVFLLRHYEAIGVHNFEHFRSFAAALYEWDKQYNKPGEPDPAIKEGWFKASYFAARYLSHIGLLDSNERSEYALNKRGKALLDSQDLQVKNRDAFSRDPVTKMALRKWVSATSE